VAITVVAHDFVDLLHATETETVVTILRRVGTLHIRLGVIIGAKAQRVVADGIGAIATAGA
jgi:hypothetical protein